MLVKKDSIVEIAGGLKFLVLDIKNIKGKEIALLQGIEDGILRFAIENTNKESGKTELMFVEDEKLEMKIAKEFDKQDNKA